MRFFEVGKIYYDSKHKRTIGPMNQDPHGHDFYWNAPNGDVYNYGQYFDLDLWDFQEMPKLAIQNGKYYQDIYETVYGPVRQIKYNSKRFYVIDGAGKFHEWDVKGRGYNEAYHLVKEVHRPMFNKTTNKIVYGDKLVKIIEFSFREAKGDNHSKVASAAEAYLHIPYSTALKYLDREKSVRIRCTAAQFGAFIVGRAQSGATPNGIINLEAVFVEPAAEVIDVSKNDF